jgi:CheY-like chemotaxis protein
MSKYLILVIDDNPEWLFLARRLLHQEGYEVMTAHNGSLGLGLAESQTPDLILLDLMMPSMNGLEICQHLKGNPETAKIPILIVTSAPKQLHEQGLTAGANMVLQKPIQLQKLKTAIRECLS